MSTKELRRKTVLCAVTTACLCGGCGDSEGVYLVLDTTIPVPFAINTVTVSASASSRAGRVCEQATVVLPVTSPQDFPLYVFLEKGSQYSREVSYRVKGYRDDTQVLADHAGWAPWPEEGRPEINITLDPACTAGLMEQLCDPGLHCVGGACGEVPGLPEAFVDPEALDAVACRPGE